MDVDALLFDIGGTVFDYRDTGFAAEFDLVADDFADLATRMEC